MTRTANIHARLAFVALMLTLAAGNLAAADSSSHPHGASSSTLQLDNGKKWATDAPLRQGMESIRAAMVEALPAIHANKLGKAKYKALAQQVNKSVGSMVANCKLGPQADAQLHLIIADLLSGAEAMQAKATQTQRRTGAIMVLDALEKYDAYFDHPGWKSIEG
jgi:hypothetical protein